MTIDISNVVQISVSTPPAGLAPYSVNNLMVLTKDTPVETIDDDFTVYTNPTDVLADWGEASGVYKAAVKVFAQSPNILTGGGKLLVAAVGSETTAAALARLRALVYFGGCGYTYAPADDDEVTDAATYCQANRILMFVVSSDDTDLVGAGGLLFKIKDGGYSQARGLFYSDSELAEDFKWGYAGLAMSTDFSGSNTTQTMHLKEIKTVVSDSGLTSTTLAAAKAVGADVYASIAGRASVFSHGANTFFDEVYGLNWFVGALEVAGFNALRQTTTKIPQTEGGMASLKSAYRTVCLRARSNQFVGPNAWTSADTFGSPEDFHRNIEEQGFYIYSAPVAAQLQADREARIAPLVQIAIKLAGAFHSTNVLVFVNR